MKNIFKLLNIIEPILCLLLVIGIIYSTLFAFSNVNWIALGGTLRNWYWYESLIMELTLIFFLVIIIFEIYMFLMIKKNYKMYTFIYLIIEFIAMIVIHHLEEFAILIIIFIFNLIKCIYRIVNEKKILK